MTFIVSSAATAAVAAASAGAITTGVAGAISAGAIGSAAAGIGAGALAGGAVGAGLGAGVAAIQGKDAGQGALMGAATGAIGGAVLPGVGGAMSGAGETAGQVAAEGATQTAATDAATQGITEATTTPLAESVGPQGITAIGSDGLPVGTNSVLANSPTPLQQGIAQGSQAVNPGGFTNPVADELAAAAPPPPGSTPMMGENMTQEASANLAKQEAMMGQHGGDTGNLLRTGVDNPASTNNVSDYVKQGATWLKDNPEKALIGGAALLPLMSGSGGPNNGTAYQPDTNTYLSPNFKRSVPQGYDPAKGYANGGGILSGLPGASIANQIYNSSIGHVIAPKLGDQIFQNKPKPAAGPMNPIVARAIEAQQQAQGQQQAFQGPNAEQQMQQAAQAQPQPPQVPTQHAANGGIMQVDGHLGGYAHGGIPRLLSGAGDGVSDSIPATIAGKEPARLADGEFVVPARIVSELGNGSTEAGGKLLQAMVDRVQARRSKTVGKGKVAVNSKARKDLPA